MNFLKLLPILLPLVDHVVTLVERLRHGASGSEKKAAAMSVVRASIPVLDYAVKEPVPWEQIAGSVDVLVDTSVATMNALGVFKKSSEFRPGTDGP